MYEKLLNLLGTRTLFWIFLILVGSLARISQKSNWDGWTNDAVRNYMIFELLVVIIFFICCGLRAKRIEKSGWLFVTMIIPFVNLYYVFVFGFTESKVRIKL